MKRFFLVEIGILEIVACLVALVLVFGTLNYFNILRLDTAFPLLSFFPHLTRTASVNNSTIAQPDGPRYFPQGKNFSYNTKKATVSLRDFLESTLQSNVLPPRINASSFAPSQSFAVYQVQWTLPSNTNAVASLFYRPTTTLVEKIRLNISLPANSPFVVSSASAQTAIQPYIAEDTSLAWQCAANPIQTYCEKFLSSPQGGKGYGLTKDTKGNLTLFACFYPAEIPTNLQIRSCIK